ncbi:MAG: endonuclease/exonuclease/phosphatase family protein [Opitutaceae bacterium]|jgi:endonuclease/exonuclease/phosphatase family metal-dependent hydrolase
MKSGIQTAILRLLCVCLAELIIFCAGRAETLTIATYNIENYVAAGRRVDGVYRPAYPKPEAAKQALRAVIHALDADVLALQEMGPAAYLEELRRDLRAGGIDYPHAALAEAADADRHVAVLSQLPFNRVQTQAGLEFRYFDGREKVKRGVLEIDLAVAGGELTLFVVHLRSRFTERADDPGSVLCRAGEAEAIRDHVLRRFPDPTAARFLILGDCNDTKGSKPLRLLTKRGKTSITKLLDAADPRGETWTYTYFKDDTYERVDHVLVSPGLVSAVAGGRAQIYDGPGVREASDHRPVVVRLELGKR